MRRLFSVKFSKARILATALLLATAPVAWGQAGLDWTAVTWNDGDFTNTYTMGNGVDITIEVTPTALGTLDNLVDFGGTNILVSSPYVDGPGFTADIFGDSVDLGLIFNPASAQGASPIEILVTFSEPVSDLEFEISDLDWSAAGAGEDARIDQVEITSPDAPPQLEAVSTLPSFDISMSTATARDGVNVSPGSDEGTLRVFFNDEVSSVLITYSEASGNDNPSSRGIGLIASLSQVPVELMSFSVE
ncbi:MAG: hypothetical protein AAF725_19105 [Acidobacteriota bacterium]